MFLEWYEDSQRRTEHFMTGKTLGESGADIDAQTYQLMRGKSYQEVLRTNGQISFPVVLRQKSRW